MSQATLSHVAFTRNDIEIFIGEYKERFPIVKTYYTPVN